MVRPDFPMMAKDEIMRRLARMKGEPFVKRPQEITIRDVANWLDIHPRLVQWHASGERPVSDALQVAYSLFFHLVDAGCIKIDFDRRGSKTLTRIPPPKVAPEKKTKPYVDLRTMTLGFDR